MRSDSTEPWDKLGNNVDNCEDLDYKCAKSASSDDDVAYRQVTISLTLGRTGWTAEVTEVKAEAACAGIIQSRVSQPASGRPRWAGMKGARRDRR